MLFVGGGLRRPWWRRIGGWAAEEGVSELTELAWRSAWSGWDRLLAPSLPTTHFSASVYVRLAPAATRLSTSLKPPLLSASASTSALSFCPLSKCGAPLSLSLLSKSEVELQIFIFFFAFLTIPNKWGLIDVMVKLLLAWQLPCWEHKLLVRD